MDTTLYNDILSDVEITRPNVKFDYNKLTKREKQISDLAWCEGVEYVLNIINE
tara:strand:- start:816 stop:974 length:159 start_codon:yes stop_codon:yes gene_type:complete